MSTTKGKKMFLIHAMSGGGGGKILNTAFGATDSENFISFCTFAIYSIFIGVLSPMPAWVWRDVPLAFFSLFFLV